MLSSSPRSIHNWTVCVPMLVSNPCCIGFCPEASGLINLRTFLTRSDAWPFFYANRFSIRHKPNASGLQARDRFHTKILDSATPAG